VNFRLGNGAAPAPKKVEASSGALPWDFAFVYRFGCNGPPLVAVRIDSSHDRFVLPAYGPRPNVVVLGPVTTLPLQLSTDDLRNIHRAYAAVASVANRDALTSWIDPPVGSAVRKESLEVDVAGEKPVATNRPTWSHLDVRAAGMWTAVSPARPGSQSPEYDERVRVLLQLIERTVASKEPVSKIPVDERSCP
jgi:hypothetical protein